MDANSMSAVRQSSEKPTSAAIKGKPKLDLHEAHDALQPASVHAEGRERAHAPGNMSHARAVGPLHPMAQLQQMLGNQAVLRGMQSGLDPGSVHGLHQLQPIMGNQDVAHRLQAKLKVNTPGDQHEQEADRVAKQVMHIPAPRLATPAVTAISHSVQRKCSCGGTCSKCQGKQSDHGHGHLRMKSAGPNATGGIAAPPIVHEALRSPGQPLDPATRAFMEPRFGHNFSAVRVHTDAQAVESARAVNAHAYTVGKDVVFDAGQFSPATSRGRELLAHELTHVAQQTSPGVESPDSPAVEGEARTLAGQIGSRVSLRAPRLHSRLGISRDPKSGAALDFYQNAFYANRAFAQTMPGWPYDKNFSQLWEAAAAARKDESGGWNRPEFQAFVHAVATYQKNRGMVVDGVVDGRIQAALKEHPLIDLDAVDKAVLSFVPTPKPRPLPLFKFKRKKEPADCPTCHSGPKPNAEPWLAWEDWNDRKQREFREQAAEQLDEIRNAQLPDINRLQPRTAFEREQARIGWTGSYEPVWNPAKPNQPPIGYKKSYKDITHWFNINGKEVDITEGPNMEDVPFFQDPWNFFPFESVGSVGAAGTRGIGRFLFKEVAAEGKTLAEKELAGGAAKLLETKAEQEIASRLQAEAEVALKGAKWDATTALKEGEDIIAKPSETGGATKIDKPPVTPKPGAGLASPLKTLGKDVGTLAGAKPGPTIARFGQEDVDELVAFWRQKIVSTTDPKLIKQYQNAIDILQKRGRVRFIPKSIDQPEFNQSEEEMTHLYSLIGGKGQVGYVHGREAMVGEAATRPDITAPNVLGEVKNWNVVLDVGSPETAEKMLDKLADQIAARRIHGPANIKAQTVILDIRGQNISDDLLQTVGETFANRSGLPIENIQIVVWDK